MNAHGFYISRGVTRRLRAHARHATTTVELRVVDGNGNGSRREQAKYVTQRKVVNEGREPNTAEAVVFARCVAACAQRTHGAFGTNDKRERAV